MEANARQTTHFIITTIIITIIASHYYLYTYYNEYVSLLYKWFDQKMKKKKKRMKKKETQHVNMRFIIINIFRRCVCVCVWAGNFYLFWRQWLMCNTVDTPYIYRYICAYDKSNSLFFILSIIINYYYYIL